MPGRARRCFFLGPSPDSSDVFLAGFRFLVGTLVICGGSLTGGPPFLPDCAPIGGSFTGGPFGAGVLLIVSLGCAFVLPGFGIFVPGGAVFPAGAIFAVRLLAGVFLLLVELREQMERERELKMGRITNEALIAGNEQKFR